MRALFVAAVLCFLAAPPPAHALAPSSLAASFAADCVAGAQAESGGTCRPAPLKLDRHCPAGTIYQPGVEGWTCEPFALKAD